MWIKKKDSTEPLQAFLSDEQTRFQPQVMPEYLLGTGAKYNGYSRTYKLPTKYGDKEGKEGQFFWIIKKEIPNKVEMLNVRDKDFNQYEVCDADGTPTGKTLEECYEDIEQEKSEKSFQAFREVITDDLAMFAADKSGQAELLIKAIKGLCSRDAFSFHDSASFEYCQLKKADFILGKIEELVPDAILTKNFKDENILHHICRQAEGTYLNKTYQDFLYTLADDILDMAEKHGIKEELMDQKNDGGKKPVDLLYFPFGDGTRYINSDNKKFAAMLETHEQETEMER